MRSLLTGFYNIDAYIPRYTKKPFYGVDLSKFKPFSDDINELLSQVTKLAQKVHSPTEAMVYYQIKLPTLIPDFANRLGFMALDTFQHKYAGKKIILNPITFKMAVQLGLIRSFTLNLEPLNKAQLHTRLGRKYIATSYQSLNVPLFGLMNSFHGLTFDVPEVDRDTSIKYKVLKAAEVRGRKNVALV